MSVHRTISTAVQQRFVAAHARMAFSEPAGSKDMSCAAAASPDVAAANREDGAATCDFSGRETHTQSQSQSRPCRHRNDGDYERCACGHVPGVMKARANMAGQGSLSPGGVGARESTNGITVIGYPRISLVT